MTYEEIFSKTKDALVSADMSAVKGHLAVEVDISGEGAGAFYIEIKDGKADVQPYEYYDRDCKLIVTGEDFLKIVDGSLDPVKAYASGKLKIEGSIDKALAFSKAIDTARKSVKKAAAKDTKASKAAKPAAKETKEKKPAAKKPAAKKK